jgi:DNA-binding XRE family transcriptional regulator
MFLTQSEFAKLLNVSFSTINRWENGRCEPTMKAKRKLNKLFQKNLKESNK